jgi:hypothetical protein
METPTLGSWREAQSQTKRPEQTTQRGVSELWLGLIARTTFGLASDTVAANSFTPIAQITLPTATCRSTLSEGG